MNIKQIWKKHSENIWPNICPKLLSKYKAIIETRKMMRNKWQLSATLHFSFCFFSLSFFLCFALNVTTPSRIFYKYVCRWPITVMGKTHQPSSSLTLSQTTREQHKWHTQDPRHHNSNCSQDFCYCNESHYWAAW